MKVEGFVDTRQTAPRTGPHVSPLFPFSFLFGASQWDTSRERSPRTARLQWSDSAKTGNRVSCDSPVAFRLEHLSSGWVPNGE